MRLTGNKIVSRVRAVAYYGIAVAACAGIAYGIAHLPGRVMEIGEPQPSFQKMSDLIKTALAPEDVAILMLGRAGDRYNGGDLADSIIALHLDAGRNSVQLVSIPRDLLISDGTSRFKINEVLVRHDVGAAQRVAEAMTGFSFDGYAVVDLELVKNIVDYFGGIDVTLSEPAIDWVSGYTMAAGEHHLSGDDAVWLIRNRFNPQGDFFREKNQQQILGRLFERFSALSSAQKISFVRKFLINSSLLRDVSVDVGPLITYAATADSANLTLNHIVVDPSTKLFTIESAPVSSGTSTRISSVVVPAQGFGNYQAIREYVSSKIEGK